MLQQIYQNNVQTTSYIADIFSTATERRITWSTIMRMRRSRPMPALDVRTYPEQYSMGGKRPSRFLVLYFSVILHKNFMHFMECLCSQQMTGRSLFYILHILHFRKKYVYSFMIVCARLAVQKAIHDKQVSMACYRLLSRGIWSQN